MMRSDISDRKKLNWKMTRGDFRLVDSRPYIYIYVTDKVANFIEVCCYALNCILNSFPKPDQFPKKVSRRGEI